MRIYTRKGDRGITSTLSGNKVNKDTLLIEVYGQLDELNSILGVSKSFIDNREINEILENIQKDIFIIGSEVLLEESKRRRINNLTIEKLEKLIDRYDAKLPHLNNFIIPGGTKGGSMLHLSRAICRRCERQYVKLSSEKKTNPFVNSYLNRLSDLLFILARYINTRKNREENIWRK